MGENILVNKAFGQRPWKYSGKFKLDANYINVDGGEVLGLTYNQNNPIVSDLEVHPQQKDESKKQKWEVVTNDSSGWVKLKLIKPRKPDQTVSEPDYVLEISDSGKELTIQGMCNSNRLTKMIFRA